MRCRGASNEDLVLAGARSLGNHVRQELDVVLERADAQLLECIALQGSHCDRQVLHGLLSLGRRNDDFLDSALRVGHGRAKSNSYGRSKRARTWRG